MVLVSHLGGAGSFFGGNGCRRLLGSPPVVVYPEGVVEFLFGAPMFASLR